MALTASESKNFAFIFKGLKIGMELVVASYLRTILIAESAPAITNGFTEAFGSPE